MIEVYNTKHHQDELLYRNSRTAGLRIQSCDFSKLHINAAPANALLKFLPLGNSPFSLNMKDPD